MKKLAQGLQLRHPLGVGVVPVEIETDIEVHLGDRGEALGGQAAGDKPPVDLGGPEPGALRMGVDGATLVLDPAGNGRPGSVEGRADGPDGRPEPVLPQIDMGHRGPDPDLLRRVVARLRRGAPGRECRVQPPAARCAWARSPRANGSGHRAGERVSSAMRALGSVSRPAASNSVLP